MFMTLSIEIGNCEDSSWLTINNISLRKLLFVKGVKEPMGPGYVGQSMRGLLDDGHLSEKEYFHGIEELCYICDANVAR